MLWDCDVILKRRATSSQLAALGAALWRWSGLDPWKPGIHRYIDNQVLADLMAGKAPAASQGACHFELRATANYDRQATIDSLRREIPPEAVEDLVVDGTSWRYLESAQ